MELLPENAFFFTTGACPKDTVTFVPDNFKSSLVYMGHITKPHGIRGELSLYFEGKSSEPLLGAVFIETPTLSANTQGTLSPAVITKARMHHGALLITLQGVIDRNQAELYRRHHLYITRDKLPHIEEDDYYQADLLELAVLITNDDGQETLLGHITSIDEPAGQEIWTITTADKKEILFPAVPEFVTDIDLDAGIVRITPPLGLIELYLG